MNRASDAIIQLPRRRLFSALELHAAAIGSVADVVLLIGWGFGTLVSVLGMVASAALDLPTGATIVCAFGVILLIFGLGFRYGLIARPRTLR